MEGANAGGPGGEVQSLENHPSGTLPTALSQLAAAFLSSHDSSARIRQRCGSERAAVERDCYWIEAAATVVRHTAVAVRQSVIQKRTARPTFEHSHSALMVRFHCDCIPVLPGRLV